MISASSLARVAACPVSAILPQVREISEGNARGSAIHAFLADVPTCGLEDALSRVPDLHLPACKAIQVDKLPACDPGAFAAEVAFAYDVVSGEARELGRGLDRDYGELAATEIPGTADVVGLAGDGETVLVFDYKSGWEELPPVAENRQQRFYALAACRAYGRKRATVTILRVKPDGSVWDDSATFDAFDLDVIAGELLDVHVAVVDAEREGATPVVGSHCRYCPAFAACPANTTLAACLGTGQALVEAPQVDGHIVLTEETAAEAWRKLKQARAVLEHIESAVRAFAQVSTVDLGDGKLLGLKESKRTTLDGGAALKVLMARYGAEVADEAVDIKSSRAAIERALRPVAERTGEPLAALVRLAIDEIGELGGVSKRTYSSVQEHKAPAAKAEGVT